MPVATIAAEGNARIQFDGRVFQVSGWSGQAPKTGWESVFAVYVGDSPDTPQMLGTYSFESGVLTFRPRFPIAPGTRGKAIFRVPGANPIEFTFTTAPRETNPTTRVEQVYPSADLLPANLLRFYVQFSAPMQRGEAWHHIRLLDRNRKPLDLPFLELDQELWDREGRRLTVLFDPGRIKRGVLPRDEVGSSLVEGGSYTLVVDKDWRDANGSPLQSPFEKNFRVLPEARNGIDLKTWHIRPPPPNTIEPLIVDFPAPLDFALQQRLIEVHAAHARVEGKISIGQQEKQWRFTPVSAWSAGPHTIQVDTVLEDVAGNRVGRPFDVDTFEPITTKVIRKTESIPFRIGPK